MTGIQNFITDEVVKYANQLYRVFHDFSNYPYTLIYESIKLDTDYYEKYKIDEINEDEILRYSEQGKIKVLGVGVGIKLRDIGQDEIETFESELRNNFLRLGEAKLQDRYANYLLSIYSYPVKPLYDLSLAEDSSFYGQVFGLPAFPSPEGRTEERSRIILNWQSIANLFNQIAGWKIAIERNIRTFTPEVYQQIQSQSTSQQHQPTEPGVSLSTFQKLFLIRLLQKNGLFPKKKSAVAPKDELEFIGVITGLTYSGHLKKANPEVEKLLDKKNLTIHQWRERIKDIRKVKDVVGAMELPEVYKIILQYEQTAIEKLESE